MKSEDFKSRFAAVKRSGAFIAIFSSQLDCRFVGLRATVREKDLAWYPHDFDQPASQFALRPRIVEVRRVNQLASLPAQRLDHPRMRVSQRGNRNSRPEIQVLFARLIPYAGAAPTSQNQVVSAIGGDNEFFEERAGFRIGG